LTFFERLTGHVGVYGWTFSDIDFALIPTGRKLPTHEHLKTLQDFEMAGIEAALAKIRASLTSGHSQEFVAGIRDNAKALADLGFVAPYTQELCQEFLQKPGVLAAKGCGALGADVVMVVFDKNHREQFKNHVTSKDVSHGLEIQVKD
jgi:hypothetical protein